MQAERAPSIESEPFGSLRGESVERYTLANSGMQVRILTYGGILQSIDVPDRAGHVANVSLGFATLDEYVRGSPFFGALIGRFANRIAGGRFTLDGVTYEVPVNDGPNSLHGGLEDHVLTLFADRYTPIDDALIPTGAIEPVAGTPLDFASPTRIGARLRAGVDQLARAHGYDHNYVLDRQPIDGSSVRLAAHVLDPNSGRGLDGLPTEPAIQFYSGNFLDGSL